MRSQVDSTCYAIASSRTVARWVEATPAGFVFHFKAFGLFTGQACPANAIPRRCRDLLPAGTSDDAQVRLEGLVPELLDGVWEAFHNCIGPAKQVRRAQSPDLSGRASARLTMGGCRLAQQRSRHRVLQ